MCLNFSEKQNQCSYIYIYLLHIYVYICKDICVCLYVYLKICKEIHSKKLTRMIMECSVPQGLPSATWRPRRVIGVVSPQVQRPENQENFSFTGISSIRVQKASIPAQKEAERANPPLYHVLF